ncbi:MAG TPA: hypothetical protein VMM92_00460 [Thermoanaerobaculia bacterium]|nr:hypothetical protein [Thermoanaerobaculia bacterium]
MTLDRLARLVLPGGAALVLLLSAALPALAGVNVWTPLGPNGGIVTTIAADPVTAGTVYAGTVGGVWKSLDAGASWALASRGLRDREVLALAIDPRQPSHLAAATLYGLFTSRDGATTWQPAVNAPTGGVSSLAVDSSSTLYAGTYYGGVWRSTDFGQTWQQRTDRFLYVFSIVADPIQPNTLYVVATNGGIFFKSTDGGATWVSSGAGLPARLTGRGVAQLALDPEVPANLFIALRRDFGQPDQVYVSRDSGAHWTADGPGALPIATGPGGAVYAGSFASHDHGATWSPVTEPPANPANAFGLEVSPVDGKLYANTDSGVFTSTDGALHWQQSIQGLAATSITAVAVLPAPLDSLLAGVDPLGILKPRPSGQGWSRGRGVPTGPQQILADPASPTVVYARVFEQILHSTDTGASWQTVTLPAVAGKNCLSYLETLATGPDVLYAGRNIPSGQSTCSQSCAVLKSTDEGATWSCLPVLTPNVRNLTVAPSSPATVYTVESANLWRSLDSGATWTLLNRGWKRLTTAIDLLTVDPTRPNVLYLSSAAGLLKSTDGGNSWAISGNGLPAGEISAIVVDPSAPSTLYVGVRFQGVYRSVDGGAHWHPQVGGLQGFSGPLAIDPVHPDTLYAGTPANGLYTVTIEP